MALEVEWIDDPRRWGEHQDVWDGLVERSGRPSIFATWDFLQCAWRHYAEPSGHRLAVFVFRDDGRPTGAAAFRVSQTRHYGLPTRRLCPLATTHADYQAPLILPAARAREGALALLDFLERHGAAWDYVDFDGPACEEDALQATRERASSRRGLELTEQELSPSPYILLDGDDALARVGASARQSTRRHQRRLQARAPLQLEVVEAPAAMPRALELYVEVERRSWKPAAGIGVGRSPRSLGFFRDLLPRLAANGRANVSFLRQGDRPLAAKIDLRLGATVWGLEWTYDQEHSAFSPGNVALMMYLEWQHARGARRYELLPQDLENKLRYARTLQPNVRLRLLQLRGLRRRLLFSATLLKARLGRAS
jgi:CelD/BcsL family acetyltransferase involved in cellulose biosynthesis